MGAGRRRGQTHRQQGSPSMEQRQRDEETVARVEKLLGEAELDVTRLRQISAARGLSNNRLRARVWPLLLGVDADAWPHDRYDELACMEHADSPTLRADIARSLWSFTVGWSDEARQEKREALMRLLNAVVNHSAGDVRYYQGLHDIASVLLLTVGERLAFPILCRLATCHLRDCTRPTLEPVAELLQLQVPILDMTDRPLARVLEGMQVPCYFALSWYITWFSHDVKSLTEVARLFDLFLSAHPMMPLYVGAACMAAAREELIYVDDVSLMHQALVNLRIGKYITTEELIRQALALYAKAKPKQVLRQRGLRPQFTVTPDAFKKDGLWEVPEAPLPRPVGMPFGALNWGTWWLKGVSLIAGGVKVKVYAVLSVSGLVVLSAYFVTRVLEHQMDELQVQVWDGMLTSK
eukprot:evm.model.scf_763.6 EVM.evm.TU.scf_763.6   scf_763:49464-53228(+)